MITSIKETDKKSLKQRNDQITKTKIYYTHKHRIFTILS